MYVCMYVCIYIYIYIIHIHIYIHLSLSIHIYIYIYIHTWQEIRELPAFMQLLVGALADAGVPSKRRSVFSLDFLGAPC